MCNFTFWRVKEKGRFGGTVLHNPAGYFESARLLPRSWPWRRSRHRGAEKQASSVQGRTMPPQSDTMAASHFPGTLTIRWKGSWSCLTGPPARERTLAQQLQICKSALSAPTARGGLGGWGEAEEALPSCGAHRLSLWGPKVPGFAGPAF